MRNVSNAECGIKSHALRGAAELQAQPKTDQDGQDKGKMTRMEPRKTGKRNEFSGEAEPSDCGLRISDWGVESSE